MTLAKQYSKLRWRAKWRRKAERITYWDDCYVGIIPIIHRHPQSCSPPHSHTHIHIHAHSSIRTYHLCNIPTQVHPQSPRCSHNTVTQISTSVHHWPPPWHCCHPVSGQPCQSHIVTSIFPVSSEVISYDRHRIDLPPPVMLTSPQPHIYQHARP